MTITERVCPNGCEVVWTTSERNGYPRYEKEAIIGFKNKEHLEEFLQKHSSFVPIYLEKESGWEHWFRFKYGSRDAVDLLDNSIGLPEELFWTDNKDEGFIDGIKDCLEDDKDNSYYVEMTQKAIDAFNSLSDDEIMIYGFDYLSKIVVVKRYTMEMNNEWDDTISAIGAIRD